LLANALDDAVKRLTWYARSIAMPNSVPLQLLCSLLVGAAGCGVGAVCAGETEPTGTAKGGECPETTGASEDAAQVVWVVEPDVCGHAYGVVHSGRDAIVVGASGGQPWIARVDELGSVVWERQQMLSGAYFAVDANPETDAFVAVGRYMGDDGEHGLLDVHDESGVVSSVEGIGGPGTAIYGVAVLEDSYAVTGVLDGFDMLLGRFSPSDGTLTTWPVPTGFGLAASVGFGVRADASGGVAVCGRASAGEGGRSWTARFDASGAELWEVRGPDPGVGAFVDCWALALGPDGDVFVADKGYVGAHLAGLAAADGALLWEASEPSTGTQAIDVGGDGTIYVGGWSADASADPFRSHETGERSGWLAAFEPSGTLLWRVAAAMPLSINALRVHEDGFVTVVGDLDPDSDCSRPWVARFEL
jgi:hypothetical protein